MKNLTNIEALLLVCATVAVAATITMCLCIHYVIPDTGCYNIKYEPPVRNKNGSSKRSCIPMDCPSTKSSTSGTLSVHSNIVTPYPNNERVIGDSITPDSTPPLTTSTSAPIISTSTEPITSTSVKPITSTSEKSITSTSAKPIISTSAKPIINTTGQSSTLSTQSRIISPYQHTVSPDEGKPRGKRNINSLDNSTIKTRRSIDFVTDNISLENNLNHYCNCPELVDKSLETEISLSKPTNYAERIYQYPYLVSITLPIWLDDISSDERIYKGAGVIVNKYSVLTGKYVTDEEWLLVTVRAGSDFWSYGGTTHSVASVAELEGTVILKMRPEFYFEVYVKPLQMSLDSEGWTSAKIVGWAQSGGKLKKYNTFNVEILDKSIISCVNCTGAGTFKYNTSKSGNILVLDDDIRVLF